jgi:pseudaminic acid synthase
MGEVKYDITDNERNKRRSLYAKKNISEGDVFTDENVGSYRPGVGLSPRYWDALLGKVSKREIQKGDVLTLLDLQ